MEELFRHLKYSSLVERVSCNDSTYFLFFSSMLLPLTVTKTNLLTPRHLTNPCSPLSTLGTATKHVITWCQPRGYPAMKMAIFFFYFQYAFFSMLTLHLAAPFLWWGNSNLYISSQTNFVSGDQNCAILSFLSVSYLVP